jgi:hypothetical protein
MADASFDDGWEDIEEEALHHLPPGEEGMLLSHAGQDATFQQVMQGVRAGYTLIFLILCFLFLIDL